MSVSIEFGTPVKVQRIAHRLKSGIGNTVHTSHRDSIRYMRVEDKKWSGEPLPDTKVDPEADNAVMIRRYPLPAPEAGIVIGQTYRIEGRVSAGRWHEENVLVEERRVPLYEVALDRGDLLRAEIVLVHEMDLETA